MTKPLFIACSISSGLNRAMVARLTLGKKKYLDVEVQMYTLLEQAEALRRALTQAIEVDAEAFEAVMASYRLPKDTDEEADLRQQAIEAAMLNAARVPLETARMAVEVMELCAQEVDIGNLNAISDGASGAALARASLSGAGYNVRINLSSLDDPTKGQDLLQGIRQLEGRADEIEASIRKQLVERGGMPLP